jgi:excisionase family DNA binding protein
MKKIEGFYNKSQAAKRLGVSRTVIERLIDEGQLHEEPSNPLYKGNGPVLIRAAEVDALAVKPADS